MLASRLRFLPSQTHPPLHLAPASLLYTSLTPQPTCPLPREPPTLPIPHLVQDLSSTLLHPLTIPLGRRPKSPFPHPAFLLQPLALNTSDYYQLTRSHTTPVAPASPVSVPGSPPSSSFISCPPSSLTWSTPSCLAHTPQRSRRSSDPPAAFVLSVSLGSCALQSHHPHSPGSTPDPLGPPCDLAGLPPEWGAPRSPPAARAPPPRAPSLPRLLVAAAPAPAFQAAAVASQPPPAARSLAAGSSPIRLSVRGDRPVLGGRGRQGAPEERGGGRGAARRRPT